MDADAIWFFSILGGSFLIVLCWAIWADYSPRWKFKREEKDRDRQKKAARWHARSNVTEQGVYELTVVLEQPDGKPLKAFSHGIYEMDDEFVYRRGTLWAEAQALAADLNSELDSQSTA